ncbi:E3 ubiquitin-protein ligase znrf3, partial [Dissostichus eleginoides]
MHPLGLCNNNDEEDLYEYGWVGVVKLEQPELDPSCLTVLGKFSQTPLESPSDLGNRRMKGREVAWWTERGEGVKRTKGRKIVGGVGLASQADDESKCVWF